MSGWISVADCKTCRTTHQEYIDAGYTITLKCATCFPGVHPYNKAAYIIYNKCSDQYIMGNNGAISINILAVDSILNDYNITEGEERLEIREEVRELSNLVLKLIRENKKD